VAAVAEGQFHIYAVETIEQGIALLTGLPAGEADESGDYPDGTIYAAVQRKLAAYRETLQAEAKPRNHDNNTGAAAADETPPEPPQPPDNPFDE